MSDPFLADPGLVGNLLVERLVGAHIWQVGGSRQQGRRRCLAGPPAQDAHPASRPESLLLPSLR